MVNLASGKLDCEFRVYVSVSTSLSTWKRWVNETEFWWSGHGYIAGDGVPPDLAVHLLALHWNRQHFAFLITYRPRESRDS